MSQTTIVPVLPVVSVLRKRRDDGSSHLSGPQFPYALTPTHVAQRISDISHVYNGMYFKLFDEELLRAFFDDLSNQYVHPICDTLVHGELFRFGQRIHLYVTPSRLLSFLRLSSVDELCRWFAMDNPMEVDLASQIQANTSRHDVFSWMEHLVSTFPSDVTGCVPYVSLDRSIGVERFEHQTALVYHSQRRYPWLYTTKEHSPSITHVYRLTLVMRFPRWVVNEDIRKRIKEVLTFYCQPFPFVELDPKWLVYTTVRWNQYSFRMTKMAWFGTTCVVPCSSCKSEWSKKMRICLDCGQTGVVFDARLRLPEWSELPVLAPDSDTNDAEKWIKWDRWSVESLSEAHFILFCGASRIHGTKVEHDYLISTVLTKFVQKMTEAAEDEAERQRQLLPVQIPLSLRRPVRQCRLTYRPSLQIDDEVSRHAKRKQITDRLWKQIGYENPYRSKKMNEEVKERWHNFLKSCRTLFGMRFPDHLMLHSTVVRRNRADELAFLVQREDGCEPESREHPRCMFFAIRLASVDDIHGTLECMEKECKSAGDTESYGLKIPLNLVKATYDGEHRATHLPLVGSSSSNVLLEDHSD